MSSSPSTQHVADRAIHLREPEMRARWSAAGFDVEAADVRYAGLRRDLTDDADGDRRIREWVRAEQEAARSAGLADDADYWRIAVAARHVAPAIGLRVY